jgi:hypothetical protein
VHVAALCRRGCCQQCPTAAAAAAARQTQGVQHMLHFSDKLCPHRPTVQHSPTTSTVSAHERHCDSGMKICCSYARCSCSEEAAVVTACTRQRKLQQPSAHTCIQQHLVALLHCCCGSCCLLGPPTLFRHCGVLHISGNRVCSSRLQPTA